jgi:hypothetical protein
MMKKAVGGALALAILLAGCGSKTDANEKNFGEAIRQYLGKEGELCLGGYKWPVAVTGQDLDLQKAFPTSWTAQVVALEAVGLAKSENAKIKGGMYNIQRYYSLTDAAKPFEQQVKKSNSPMVIELCWGKIVLDKIVKWKGPMKLGDYQEANVTYLYKIEGLADWAKKPEILAAFPKVKQTIEGAGKQERQVAVGLSSIGWEVAQ